MEKYLSYFKTNYRSLSGAFFLGLLLWFTVTSDKEYTHFVYVPLSIKTMDEDLVLLKLPPEQIKVKIKGSGRSLFALNFVDRLIGIEFLEISSNQVLDLSEYKNQFHFPRDLGIEILDIVKPKKITIEVDKYAERLIPIKINNDIKTVPGYLLVDYSSEHDSVLVSGPESLVAKMNFVETEKIKNTDVRFPFNVSTDLINPENSIISIEPKTVNLNFIIEQLVERTVYNIPIKVINVPGNLSAEASPETISLRVKGGESRVSALTIDDIGVLFDYTTDYRKNKQNYVMQIKTPIDVAWVEASPQFFNIKLVRRED